MKTIFNKYSYTSINQVKLYKLLIISVLILISPGIRTTESRCFEFYRSVDCILELKNKFTIHKGSTNIPIKPNEMHQIAVPLIGGKSYFITFCTRNEYYPIHFKIIETKEGENKVVYDNKVDDYLMTIGFRLKLSKYYKFEVEVLGSKENKKDSYYDCLGMLIQYK